jgi:3-oxoacyl-[acyl-carrier protein] reductase
MAKKIIVTGGTRGIGKALVQKLCAEGNDVAFSYRANAEMAERLVAEIAAQGGKSWAFKSDVANFDEAGAFVQQAKQALGDVDVLINNAGITADKSLFIMPKEEWESVIDTNLNGCFNVTRHIIGYFMKLKKGCVVNITSVSGLTGLAGQTNYCASKAGMIGFTRALAKEVGKLGIPVNCVAPGFIETDMTVRFDEKHLAEIKKQIPMQRLGTVEEVANLVSFLISEKATYITGQTFVIDGGLTA